MAKPGKPRSSTEQVVFETIKHYLGMTEKKTEMKLLISQKRMAKSGEDTFQGITMRWKWRRGRVYVSFRVHTDSAAR